MNTQPKFRYIGVTDECIECQKCGKADLKSTVILAILDADGNTEEVTYYGSTCAAKALSVKGGGRRVLEMARNAHDRTLLAAKEARETLAYYGLPETGEPDRRTLINAQMLCAHAHRFARWAETRTPAEWRADVLDMLARRRAQIAEAALLTR